MLAVADPGALLHFFLPAEPKDLRARSRSHGCAGGVVGVEHGEVAALLIFKYARFRVHIGFECAVPVEMVGRDIQYDRNFRTESLNGFQLKAGNLEHNDGLRVARSANEIAGVPMLPPTSAGTPAAVMISPVSVVVVVLPFDPVMATIGPGRNWAASSTSPITASPKARACTNGGASTGTPG